MTPGAVSAIHRATLARKTFTHDQLGWRLTGIEYRDTDAFIDEIPMADKDIDQVMADAADLVDAAHPSPGHQRQGRLIPGSRRGLAVLATLTTHQRSCRWVVSGRLA